MSQTPPVRVADSLRDRKTQYLARLSSQKGLKSRALYSVYSFFEVYAKEKLTASVSGSGEVRYAGSLISATRTVRGSGTIEALQRISISQGGAGEAPLLGTKRQRPAARALQP